MLLFSLNRFKSQDMPETGKFSANKLSLWIGRIKGEKTLKKFGKDLRGCVPIQILKVVPTLIACVELNAGIRNPFRLRHIYSQASACGYQFYGL